MQPFPTPRVGSGKREREIRTDKFGLNVHRVPAVLGVVIIRDKGDGPNVDDLAHEGIRLRVLTERDILVPTVAGPATDE